MFALMCELFVIQIKYINDTAKYRHLTEKWAIKPLKCAKKFL